MAIPHAEPAEMIDVLPPGTDPHGTRTQTLVKTDSLELVRLVLPAGKKIAPHSARGEITVQCLEGKVMFHARDSELELTTGKLIYLEADDVHSVHALEDSSLLLTLLLRHRE